jgi:hypothetical protein
MIHTIKTPVSVHFFSNQATKSAMPTLIIWKHREYTVTKIGLHHTYRQGRTLFHVYSVAAQTLFFKLVCNTDTLEWFVEQIADAEVN